MSADECLQHKWLAQTNCTMKSVKLPTDRLKKFIIRRKWQVRPLTKRFHFRWLAWPLCSTEFCSPRCTA